MDQGHLRDLVGCSLLDEGNWLALDGEETVATLSGYVVSFVCFHERGLIIPLHSFIVTLFDYLQVRLYSRIQMGLNLLPLSLPYAKVI